MKVCLYKNLYFLYEHRRVLYKLWWSRVVVGVHECAYHANSLNYTLVGLCVSHQPNYLIFLFGPSQKFLIQGPPKIDRSVLLIIDSFINSAYSLYYTCCNFEELKRASNCLKFGRFLPRRITWRFWSLNPLKFHHRVMHNMHQHPFSCGFLSCLKMEDICLFNVVLQGISNLYWCRSIQCMTNACFKFAKTNGGLVLLFLFLLC